MRLMLVATVAYAAILFGNDAQESEAQKAKANLDRTSNLSTIKKKK